MADDLLHLLTWLSPAFPTGGFACSHGLEWAVEVGDVADAAGLQGWLADLLRFGAGRNDAILLRQAYRSGNLAEIAGFAAACAPSRELAGETISQGTAFVAASRPWLPAGLGDVFASIGPIAYPVAVGALAAATGIDEDATALAYLHAWTANIISAGVRLIPLGQNAGLVVQAGLEAVVRESAMMTKSAGLEDISSCCIGAEIASMRHETQHTRLFRS